jgi:hypothetical protein
MQFIKLSIMCSILLSAQIAAACGGFFCNNNQPITQAAERIFFALDEGRIHMHVRIQYDGPPDQFGWLLPVPADSTLEVKLSTEALFDSLDQFYAPQFRVQRTFDDNCPPPPVAESAFDGDSTQNEAGGGGVNVISREAVGPYDRVILQAQSVDELRAWLDDENFFIPEVIDAKLGPYVDRGQHFVAIKLLSSASTNDIAPLYLNFVGSKPSIPIVPTSVAANPDMGVLVHLLYDQRSVPLNYLHVQINEAGLDLSNGGQNYPDVVSQAMDEAGGKGFTTDFAGELDGRLEDSVAAFEESTISALATVEDIFQTNLAGDADFQRVANNVIAFPEGVNPSEFWQSPFSYQGVLTLELDTDALWAQLDMEVNPARTELQRLMSAHRYLTRLYSTLSPEEMTLDPEFTFNPDMTEDVANVRTIEVFISCSPEGESDESTATMVNSAGETVAADLSGATAIRRENGVTVQGMDVPASAIIEITGERGAPEIVGSMGMVDPSVVDGMNDDMPTPSPGGLAPNGDAGCNDGCSTGSSNGPLELAVLCLLLVGLQRRRNS